MGEAQFYGLNTGSDASPGEMNRIFLTLLWQKTVLHGTSFDLYAPVEDSLNGLERLAGEPIVAYTTDPQRR